MATAQIFEVKFAVVKAAASGHDGNAYQYRREPRKALVQAVSGHPKDILTVLNSNIPLIAGEAIELLGVSQLSGGTEGAGTVLT